MDKGRKRMRIGGMFPLEREGKAQESPWDEAVGCMSGRCALYYCLLDMHLTPDSIAYVPAYTCETVLGSYLKAGCRLRYYDIDPKGLKPIWQEEDLDGVKVLALCGYYGVLTYDHSFVKTCKSRGIRILQDTTHSPYSLDPDADYWAGSLRKWMGIASGGVALKKAGPFTTNLFPPDPVHLEGRYEAMKDRQKAIDEQNPAYDEHAKDVFWKTEMRLRKTFDANASDGVSISIAQHFDWQGMKEKRREHFFQLIRDFHPTDELYPVLTRLRVDEVPSHFTLYAKDREKAQAYLASKSVASTVYWPVPPMIDDINRYPGAKWIGEHILSIQLDQRYSRDDMAYLADVLNGYVG